MYSIYGIELEESTRQTAHDSSRHNLNHNASQRTSKTSQFTVKLSCLPPSSPYLVDTRHTRQPYSHSHASKHTTEDVTVERTRPRNRSRWLQGNEKHGHFDRECSHDRQLALIDDESTLFQWNIRTWYGSEHVRHGRRHVRSGRHDGIPLLVRGRRHAHGRRTHFQR